MRIRCSFYSNYSYIQQIQQLIVIVEFVITELQTQHNQIGCNNQVVELVEYSVCSLVPLRVIREISWSPSGSSWSVICHYDIAINNTPNPIQLISFPSYLYLLTPPSLLIWLGSLTKSQLNTHVKNFNLPQSEHTQKKPALCLLLYLLA